MKQVIMLIVTTEVVGMEYMKVHGTPITRTCLGSPRTLVSLAGPTGGMAPALVCSVSATALALRPGPLRFGPRCFRFDQNLENFGTVSKNPIEM